MELNLSEAFFDLAMSTGFANMTWQQLLMIGISLVLFYLAIVRGFEPLLLVPIAFGMLLANIPDAGLMNPPQPGIDPFTGKETA
jgi:Na+-transporting methylmalonyl-CoA/oxaloacetate decarboxylase beta subunit